MIKSINQYYNKQLAYYRSIENKKGNFNDTKRIQKLHLTRNNKLTTTNLQYFIESLRM